MEKTCSACLFCFFIRYAFADILESERSYVSDLQRIIEIYLYELTRQECPWFVKEKKDLLFSNIEDIFAFHKVYVFVSRHASERNSTRSFLRRCFSPCRLFFSDLTHAIEHDPSELAYVFLRRRDQFLNLYSQYMYDRTRSEHVLQTNPNIQRYFDELTQRLGLQASDLTLNHLLNRPIQRLEKYKNILQVNEDSSRVCSFIRCCFVRVSGNDQIHQSYAGR